MCELDVFIDGEKVFERAIRLRRDKDKIIVRSVLGNKKTLSDVEFDELDIPSEKLTLTKRGR
ncbi:hypothetical protein AKJ48_04125 [candidate division MSBL1 archaeon SCGC-AAA261O19]|nr:hypothetical protein AKJ42_03190 [candidate division MSBL1 archaeon SCGC-AAA261C02]KXB03200.1 hypothetical protein AKJ48_04125 [candidate division MSBL1 archaeon SCGC-AAA261O19]